jgi:predicted Zn-ribbon and HTH transcriptional regulator
MTTTSRERVRVRCTSCGWSGGRSTVQDPARLPCFKCGASVVQDGTPYLEHRVMCGCRGCGWYGWRQPSKVSAGCPKCETTATELVQVVTLDGVQLHASAAA